jgi:preprotein translocase subunit YajC
MRPYLSMTCVVGTVFSVFAQETAAAAPAPGTDWMTMGLMLVSMFAIIFLFMIRPEQKKQKERQAMMSSMAKGDKVLTIGGIYGKIAQIKDATIMVKVSDNTIVEVARSAVSAVIDKDKKEAADKDEKVKE